MRRHTVYDSKLRRYVVPLSKGTGTERTPEVKTLVGGPQDLLLGELIDHLAGLEIAVEEMEERALTQKKVYLVMVTPYDRTKPQRVNSVWRSEEDARKQADLLNAIGNGRDAHHWVAEEEVIGEEGEG